GHLPRDQRAYGPNEKEIQHLLHHHYPRYALRQIDRRPYHRDKGRRRRCGRDLQRVGKIGGRVGAKLFLLTLLLNDFIMPKEKNYKWKLGLFSVAALVIAIAAIYYIGKQKNKFGSVLHISAIFNSVSGLKVGSNVR